LIQSFIASNNINGKIKFWVTGHSRGAAIANLYSKYLTDKYGVKNVFAFTFATPRVSKNVSKDSKKIYPNIRNYLNEGDFVTELAPESWGYNRYGEDISLDSKYKSKMKSIFYKDTQIKYEG
jgi:predicted lipase